MIYVWCCRQEFYCDLGLCLSRDKLDFDGKIMCLKMKVGMFFVYFVCRYWMNCVSVDVEDSVFFFRKNVFDL